MKIVVAFDKFKGSLDAPTACQVVREAIHAVRPEIQTIAKPLADGGDGTAATLVTALQGEWITVSVTGPLSPTPIPARYGWFSARRLAVIEMARASGLALLQPHEYDPLRATTYGTGELIRDALERGARRILLGVGGSATVDGGVGAALALGWQFLDAAGQPVGLGGGELERIAQILPPNAPCRRSGAAPEVDVLCDVDNPLVGDRGAARVFGPQKGATPAMVARLDQGLRHLGALVKEQLGHDLCDRPGAGAAGGLSAGAVAFLGAKLVPGIDTVIRVTGLAQALAGAAWVVTGEGRFDEQSLHGKVVDGVTRLAAQHGVRVAVLAGTVNVPPEIYRAVGITRALATKPDNLPLAAALPRAAELLAVTARRFAAEL